MEISYKMEQNRANIMVWETDLSMFKDSKLQESGTKRVAKDKLLNNSL